MPETAEAEVPPMFEKVAANDAAMTEINTAIAVAISAKSLVIAVSVESLVIAVAISAKSLVIAISAKVFAVPIVIVVPVVQRSIAAILIVNRSALRSPVGMAEL